MATSRNPDFVIATEQMKSLYDEYVKVGFTEDQALKIMIALIIKNKSGN